jgi:plasmid stabilization system protein ParE
VSLRIEYHELVDTDLATAWTWYENQENGLGDRFLDAIHATVKRASQWPNAGVPVLRDRDDEIIERKLPAHGFPYAIRYRILGDRLLVIAVLHQHRRPDFGNDRQAP